MIDKTFSEVAEDVAAARGEQWPAIDPGCMKFSDKEVRVQQVIITTNQRRGRGIDSDPIRRVLQVWSMDGELIAEKDFA